MSEHTGRFTGTLREMVGCTLIAALLFSAVPAAAADLTVAQQVANLKLGEKSRWN